MIEFPMPEITQGSDQNAIRTIAEIIYPGFIATHPERGHIMRVDGEAQSEDLGEAASEARVRFAQVLGVLRAFRHGCGELAEEVTRLSARDEQGNQFIPVGTARSYEMFPGELEAFAQRAAVSLRSSLNFHDALALLGGPNRSATDYYAIHEYAQGEFNGLAGVRDRLGVSVRRQTEFKKSANNLRPADGGRHARGRPEVASLDLDDLSRFARDLMAAWINAQASGPP